MKFRRHEGVAEGGRESSGEDSGKLSSLDADAAQRQNQVYQLERELVVRAQMEKKTEDHGGNDSASESHLVERWSGRKHLQ